jgi:hypothetical protein
MAEIPSGIVKRRGLEYLLFHARDSVRRKTNKIDALIRADGSRCEA